MNGSVSSIKSEWLKLRRGGGGGLHILNWEKALRYNKIKINVMIIHILNKAKICWELSEKIKYHWLSQEKKKVGDYLGAPSVAPKSINRANKEKTKKLEVFNKKHCLKHTGITS